MKEIIITLAISVLIYEYKKYHKPELEPASYLVCDEKGCKDVE